MAVSFDPTPANDSGWQEMAAGFGSILHLGAPPRKEVAQETGRTQTPGDLKIEADHWMRWITLGEEYSPDRIRDWRSQARGGTLRYWYAFADEAQRLGFTAQLSKLRELVRGAEYKFFATPKDTENSEIPKNLVALSAEVRDYVEEQLEDLLPDFFASVGVDAYYCGLSAAAPHFKVRGYRGRWDKVLELEQVASRRFEWNVPTRSFRVYADPTFTRAFEVNELMERGSLLFLETDKAMPLDQRGMLWKLVSLWAMAQYGLRYWAETVQDHGKPIFTASYTAGDTKAETIAKAAVQKLAFDLRVAHPNSVVFQNLQSAIAGGAGGGAHQSMLEYVNRGLAEIILGHSGASSAQVGAGSQNVAEEADDDTRCMVNGVLRRVARAVQEQLVYPLVARAIGEERAGLITPRLTAQLAETPDHLREAQIIAQLIPVGVKLKVSEVAEKIGYSVVEEGDEYVEMPKTEPGASGEPLGKAIGAAKAGAVKELGQEPGGKPPLKLLGRKR